MSIDRSNTYSDTNPPPTNGATAGANFLDQYGGYLDALIDTAMLRLANVAGTDTITATAEPFAVPSSGLVSGMKFTLVPAANNTGAVTLNIDSRGAEAVVSSDSSALTADSLVSGTRYFLEFDGTNFVIVGQASGGSGATSSRTTYDTTAVWENNYSADTLILVELWGAGGGGSSGNIGNYGGGGAGYATKLFKAGNLPASLTITIPSGGALETDGGNATFGSLLTAYGGGRAEDDTGSNTPSGGCGGGELGAGTLSTPGAIGGGGGNGADASSIFGGGGGGSNSFGSGGGGDAVYGGGGGGGRSTSAGGTSVHGGDGGSTGSAGQRPGGGGGANAVGGAGRCIVTVYG